MNVIELSKYQYEILINQMLNEQSPLYNIGGVYYFNGVLDLERFKDAVYKTVKKYTVLRMKIREMNGEYYQEIFNDIEPNFVFTELFETSCEEITEKCKKNFQIPFDFLKEFLYYFELIKYDDNKYVFYVKYHHILVDSYGVSRIFKEIAKNYNVCIDKNEITDDENDYLSYLTETNKYFLSDEYANTVQFWKDEFDDVDSQVSAHNSESRSIKITLEGKKYEEMLGFCRKNKVSGMHFFIGILSAYFSRVYYKNKIIIGVPVLNRSGGEKNVVALYANIIPLLVNVDGNLTFSELCSNIRAELKRVQKHRRIAISDINNVRDNKLNVDILLSFEKILHAADLDGVELSLNTFINNAEPRDLSVYVREFGAGEDVDIDFSYNTEFFNDNMKIEDFRSNFLYLFELLQKNSVLNSIDMICPKQKEMIIKDCSNYQDNSADNIVLMKRIYETCVKYSDNTAIVDDINTTYLQLWEKSSGILDALSEKGVKKGDKIIVSMQRSADLIASIYAVNRLGAVFVPVDYRQPVKRISVILESVDPKIVLTRTGIDVFDSISGNFEKINVDVVESSDNPYISDVSAKDECYIIFTSGSTGIPKGVEVNFGGLNNIIDYLYEQFPCDFGDSYLFKTNITFDVCMSEIYGFSVNGGSLFIMHDNDEIDPDKYIPFFSKVTHINFVPTMVNILLDSIGSLSGKKCTLKYLMIAGEKLKSETVKRAVQHFPNVEIVNLYGPTEATVYATSYIINKNVIEGDVSIGKAVANSCAFVVNQDLRIQARGAIGELCLYGRGISNGYYNDKQLTDKVFIKLPYFESLIYRTGDYVKLHSDGNIEYIGRIDKQVKVHGFRIQIGDIENAILRYDSISECAVLIKGENNDKEICAYFVSENEVNVNDLRSFLNMELPYYMIPNRITALDAMPMNSSGKTDLKKLSELSVYVIDDREDISNSEFDIDKKKAFQVLKRVLGIEHIGREDTFLSLGGDSIKAIIVLNELRVLGFDVKINDIMKNGSIADMINGLKNRSKDPTKTMINKSTFELSPIQHDFIMSNDIGIKFNQSILLKCKDRIDFNYIAETIKRVINSHPSLRIKVRKYGKKYLQSYNDEISHLEFAELINSDNIDDDAVLKAVNETNDSISCADSRMIRALLIKTKKSDYLYLCAHHFVVDFISWQIIIQDISLIYESLSKVIEYKEPVATDPYDEWIEKCIEYSKRNDVLDEISYWEDVCTDNNFNIDREFLLNKNRDFMKISLDKVSELNRAADSMNTSIEAMLFAAIQTAFYLWKSIEKITFITERHGRNSFIDADVYRTVGWFTSKFPITFSEVTNSIIDNIRYVDKTLKSIPFSGFNYGLLETYINYTDEEKIYDVLFNYMGDIDNAINSDKFELKEIMYGKSVDEDYFKNAVFDFEIYVKNNILNIDVDFSSKLRNEIDCSEFIEIIKKSIDSVCAEVASNTADDYIKIPLTEMQKGILFHYLKDESKSQYVEMMDLKLSMNIERQRFFDAYNILCDNYLFINSRIKNIFGDYYQVLVEKDLSNVFFDMHTGTSEAVTDYKNKIKADGFDLENESPVKIGVFNMDGNICRIIFAFHHIAADGWTFSQLLNDFLLIYKADSPSDAVISPKLSYKEYYENEIKLSEQETIEYYKTYLSGYDNAISIPSSCVKSDLGYQETFEYEISKSTISELQRRSHENNLTMNAMLQTAVGVLLSKANNVKDVVFGTVVSTRAKMTDALNTVGLFINTIPVRVKIDDNDDFYTAVLSVQDHFIKTLTMKDCSIAEIAREIRFPCICAFENYPIEKGLGDTVELVDVYEETNYDFNISFLPHNDSITINIIYNTSEYTQKDAQVFCERLNNILSDVAGDFNKPVKRIRVMDDEEKNRILYGFNNDSELLYGGEERTIYNIFAEKALLYGDRTAIVNGNKSVSYLEMLEQINLTACYFHDTGIKEDMIIAIDAEVSIQRTEVIFALLKIGAAYLPLMSTWPIQKRKSMMEDMDVTFIITDKKEYESVDFVKCIYIDSLNGLSVNDKSDYSCSDPTKKAIVIYTSGSTGKSKGVLINQYAVVNTVINQKYISIDSTDIVLGLANFVFDASLFDMFGSLLNGAMLVLTEKNEILDVDKLRGLIVNNNVTKFFTTTAMFNVMIDSCLDSLKNVRVILFGGEKVSEEHVIKARENLKNTQLVHMYGPTEAVIFSTYHVVQDNYSDTRTIPIGKTIRGTRTYILDDDLNVVPVGMYGEIYIGGKRLSNEYYDNPGLNKERFLTDILNPNEKMYKTGDIAKWLEDGSIEFIERSDFQVKIRGYRIELGEIEHTICLYPTINKAFAMVYGVGNLRRVYAFIEASENVNIPLLYDFLMEKMADYMIPSAIYQVDTLLLNNNGKIDRNYYNEYISERSGKLSSTDDLEENEKKILDLFRKALKNEGFGFDDDLFSCGGNSLSAMLLSGKISSELCVRISVSDIFKYGTPRRVSDYLKALSVRKVEGISHNDIKIYPASRIQKRLYSIEQGTEGKSAYNITAIYRISKELDIAEFEKAFAMVIERHDSLRTRFIWYDGELMQKVEDSIDCRICSIDDKDFIKNHNNYAVKFQLDSTPLFKITYVNAEQERYILFEISHLIADGYSVSIIIDEVNRFYNGKVLDKVEYHYIDYTKWDEEVYRQGQDYISDKQYWDNVFETSVERPDLPYDYPHPDMRDFRGNTVRALVDNDIWKDLSEYCQSNKVTDFSFLISLYYILLYQYSGDNDIVIGVPLANRINGVFEKTIGMFVNTLPIRFDINIDIRFSELIRKISDICFEAMSHSNYQMNDIENASSSLNGKEIFNVSFNLQNLDMSDWNINNAEFEMIPVDSNISKTDLTLQISYTQSELLLEMEYSAAVFKKQTVSKMLNSYISILHCVNSIIKNKEYSTYLSDIISLSVLNKTSGRSENKEDRSAFITKSVNQYFDSAFERFGSRKAIYYCSNKKSKNVNSIKAAEYIIVGGENGHDLADAVCGSGIDACFCSYDEIGALLKIIDDQTIKYCIVEVNDFRVYSFIDTVYNDRPDIIIKSFNACGKMMHQDQMSNYGMIGKYVVSAALCEVAEALFDEKSIIDYFYNNRSVIIDYNGSNTVISNIYNSKICILKTTSIIDDENAEKLKNEFGTVKVILDVSSLSEEQRSVYCKNYRENGFISNNNVIALAEQCKEYGFELVVRAVNGLPYVTENYVNESVDTIKELYKVNSEVIVELRRFIADPDDIFADRYEEVGMENNIRTFEDHLYYSYMNSMDDSVLPYIKYKDPEINDKIDYLEEYLIRSNLVKNNNANVNVEEYTYSDLERMVNNMLFLLKSNNVCYQDRVGILLDNSLTAVVTMIATLKMGAVYVPINSEYPQERIDFIIKDSNIKCLVTNNDILNSFDSEIKVIKCEDLEYADVSIESELSTEVKGSDLAYIIYTSGSTGIPKGVMIRNNSIVNFADWRIREYGFTQDDVTLQTLSFAFDGFGTNFYSSLLSGGSLVLLSSDIIHNYGIISDVIKKLSVTNFSTVPAIYSAILSYFKIGDYDKLRFVVLAGEKSSRNLIKESKKILPMTELINEYGPTECCITSTFKRNMDEETNDNIGSAVAGGKLYIFNSDLNEVPDGVSGELCVSGILLADGYVHPSEKDKDKFICINGGNERIYRTGDLVKRNDSGEIIYLGRIDDQIKINGNRIELSEIENIAGQIKEIVSCAAAAYEDDRGKKICFYYVSNGVIDEKRLRSLFADKLPGYMVPLTYMRINEIPLNYNGKVDRSKLLPPVSNNNSNSEVVLTEKGKIVLDCVKTIFSTEDISVSDNFFDVGGDSIKAIRLVSALKEKGYSIVLRDLYKYPVLADLADFIEIENQDETYDNREMQLDISPIQDWFFGQDFDDKNHWNQSVLLECQDIPFDVLDKAWNLVTQNHSSLRTKFISSNGKIIQYVSRSNDEKMYCFDKYDIKGNNGISEMKDICDKMQCSLDIEKGDLTKLALFRYNNKQYVFIVMHHLIVDSVSWYILLNDFERYIDQILNGDISSISANRSSIHKYISYIQEYPERNPEEEILWSEINENVRYSFKLEEDRCCIGDADNYVIQLDEEDTDRILSSDVQTDIILLVCLIRAISYTAEHETVSVNYETNGRMLNDGRIDFSNLVGWLTTQYPVVINVNKDETISTTIQKVSDYIKDIPSNGIGYLLYSNQESVNTYVPSFSFNYLGDSRNSANKDTMFKVSDVVKTENISRKCRMPFYCMLNALIDKNCLVIDVNYNNSSDNPGFYETLINNLRNELNSMVHEDLTDDTSEEMDFLNSLFD